MKDINIIISEEKMCKVNEHILELNEIATERVVEKYNYCNKDYNVNSDIFIKEVEEELVEMILNNDTQKHFSTILTDKELELLNNEFKKKYKLIILNINDKVSETLTQSQRYQYYNLLEEGLNCYGLFLFEDTDDLCLRQHKLSELNFLQNIFCFYNEKQKEFVEENLIRDISYDCIDGKECRLVDRDITNRSSIYISTEIFHYPNLEEAENHMESQVVDNAENVLSTIPILKPFIDYVMEGKKLEYYEVALNSPEREYNDIIFRCHAEFLGDVQELCYLEYPNAKIESMVTIEDGEYKDVRYYSDSGEIDCEEEEEDENEEWRPLDGRD